MMYLKGENTAKDFKSDGTGRMPFTPWEQEEVWCVDDQKYITGEEYEKRYGMPRRKYIMHEGKELLYCEYLKVKPPEKKNYGITFVANNGDRPMVEFVRQIGDKKTGEIRYDNEKVGKYLWRITK